MKIIRAAKPELNRVEKVFNFFQTGARISDSGGGTNLTQAQVEDSTSEIFGAVSGQRIWQAVIAWGETAASVFKGILFGYKEQRQAVTWSAGAATIDGTTCANVLDLATLTQNSVLTVDPLPPIGKPLTLYTVADTGTPGWTLDIIANGKTLTPTRNGSGTADRETFEFESDGTELLTPENGGLVWVKGV